MTDKAHILVVDDDSRILKLLKKFLSLNGYLVSTSTSAHEASEVIKNFQIDLMILDVMMPNVTGIEFARQLKLATNSLPIIMLTALSEPDDVINGLEAGANDYISKPFNPKELLLRINNLLETRALHKKISNNINFGPFNFDLKTHQLTCNDDLIKLTESEATLLVALLNANGEIVSRAELAKIAGLGLERSIDVQINRLRAKLEIDVKMPQFLKTIRGKGYVLYR